ncbi:MAG: hypothetical protein O2887_10060 [Bacteroidetes bacterium]|nr:hypothetical protein [Bacteroidota bacterium]MDA1120813.1 hypothetical protein [Bacteroidota bacterium]
MWFSKIRLTVLLSVICFFGYSQNLEKLDKKAEDTFFEEDFVNAIPLYNEILSIDPDNNNTKYKIELCSLLIQSNRTKPLSVILDYAGTQGRRDKFYDYWLGRIYIMRSAFDEAITSWNAFLNLKAYKSQIIVDETNQLLEIASRA